MELPQEMKVLNQPVLCPWTSSAPLQSTTVTKIVNFNDPSKNPYSSNVEGEKVAKTADGHEEKNEETETSDRPKSEPPNPKHSSSQFFHFLRLMQLFPNVHPATLHTVMTLCKNDFFVAVDKLLYAKRCKELYQNRRNLLQNFANKNQQRFGPYPCKTNFCQNLGCTKQHVIKLDAKKLLSRNRYSKAVADKPECIPDLVPVTLQCNVPIQPLSPVTPKDLSMTNETTE